MTDEEDKCFNHKGEYVDFVQHINGTWSVLIANKRVVEGLESKKAA